MWRRPAATDLELRPGEVHVWRVYTEDSSLGSLPFERILSYDELAKACRHRREEDRRGFILNRGLLRCLLSRYLHIPPIQVAMQYGRNGKPRLGHSVENLHFNLSHARGLTLLAFGRDLEIGIDVERIDPSIDETRLATWLHLPGSEPLCADLPRSERLRTVLEAWVRMEAMGKARGMCLDDMLNGSSESSKWEIIDIDAGPGYAAALALKAGHAPSFLEWMETDPFLPDVDRT